MTLHLYKAELKHSFLVEINSLSRLILKNSKSKSSFLKKNTCKNNLVPVLQKCKTRTCIPTDSLCRLKVIKPPCGRTVSISRCLHIFTVVSGSWWCSSLQGSACCLRPSGRGAGARQTGGWGSSGSCSWP